MNIHKRSNSSMLNHSQTKRNVEEYLVNHVSLLYKMLLQYTKCFVH